MTKSDKIIFFDKGYVLLNYILLKYVYYSLYNMSYFIFYFLYSLEYKVFHIETLQDL
jgi:hypothetical protein